MSTHIRGRIIKYGIDTSHFVGSGWALGKKLGTSPKKLRWQQVLVRHTKSYRTHVLRRALIESGRPFVCEQCGGGPEWNGQPLVLEVDHKNGDWQDDRRENLQFVCPNCHTQTDTFRSRNRIRRVAPVGPGTLIKPPSRFNSEHADRPTKITWPSRDELAQLVRDLPLTEIGRQLGVSSVAVKKRCSKLGLRTRTRGAWARNQFTESRV